MADHAETTTDKYVPTFSAETRKKVYVFCVIGSILTSSIATIIAATGAPAVAVSIIAALPGIIGAIGSAFGVKYAGISQ